MIDDSTTTLALTLHQPWASLICRGPKRVENRTWAPPEDLIGKRIWIHAGKTFDAEAFAHVFPGGVVDSPEWRQCGRDLGKILGSARVAGWYCNQTGDGRAVTASTETVEAALASEWFSGPIGWVLDRVQRLVVPVPWRGAQKLWRVPPELLSVLRASEALTIGTVP